LGFFFLVGCGLIVGVGSSVFAAFIEVDMKWPVRSIGDHLRSQNFYPKARKIRVVLNTHQDIIRHDALVRSRSSLITMSMAHLKVTGKRTSPVRSQILPSQILFKEVTTTKKSMLIRWLCGGGASY